MRQDTCSVFPNQEKPYEPGSRRHPTLVCPCAINFISIGRGELTVENQLLSVVYDPEQAVFSVNEKAPRSVFLHKER